MTPTTASSALNARALGSSTRQTRTKERHVIIRSTAADDDKRVAFERAESALGARALSSTSLRRLEAASSTAEVRNNSVAMICAAKTW
jgi:Tfp pilus assembly protein PilX